MYKGKVTNEEVDRLRLCSCAVVDGAGRLRKEKWRRDRDRKGLRRDREKGEEIKDERATNHEQWIVTVRMRDNGCRIEVPADRAMGEIA
jgi:hypothetical protein